MYLVTPQPQGDAAKNTLEAIYQAIGSKAADALQAATRNAARACGVEGFTGIIKENMRADIVAFDGDLEKDFQQTLYKVKFVMKDGEIYINK
jgi:imidazolonepropionase-like amidohydrolase